MNDLPTIFTSPYQSFAAPEGCCCGSPSGVEINFNPAPLVDENMQVITRMDQASRIIAAANARGFPIFQGS